MKREPVLTASVAVGVVMSFLTMAIALGWLRLNTEQMGAIEAFLLAVVPILLALAGGWWARQRVTPVAAPRDDRGRELVPKE